MSNPVEASSQPSIHKSVGYWAGLLARTMEAEFNRRLEPHGLSRMSYAVLGAIVFDGCTKPSEVADFLRVDRGAVTRLMDKLAQQGLIERSTGTLDRRSVSITVTPKGVALAKELQRHSRAVNDLFTAHLKPEDADRFVDLVKTMLAKSKESPKSL